MRSKAVSSLVLGHGQGPNFPRGGNETLAYAESRLFPLNADVRADNRLWVNAPE